jgi:hypothetical protein
MDATTPDIITDCNNDGQDTSHLYPPVAQPYDTECVTGSHYNGWPLVESAGPFLRKNLDRTIRTLQGAMDDYKQLIAIRCVLSTAFPITFIHEAFHNGLMINFIEKLHNKVRYGQRQLTGYHASDMDANIDYLWRADNPSPGMHRKYYLILLLNRVSYARHSMDGNDTETLKYRIRTAWSEALGIGENGAGSLIRYPDHAPTLFKSTPEDLAALFTFTCVLSRTFETDHRIGTRLFTASR